MNPFRTSTVRAYQDVGLETSIAAASPHQLVMMLFDGALSELSFAREHMISRNVPAKGQAISRAIRIIGEGLRGSLDMERGGAIAVQLGALYDYMTRRLVEANLKNNPATLAEVTSLLCEIRSAWAQIGVRGPAAPAASPPGPHDDRRAVSYGAA
jgi:flagellar protein FliS